MSGSFYEIEMNFASSRSHEFIEGLGVSNGNQRILVAVYEYRGRQNFVGIAFE